jgi:AbrB family looped-hinge helix DNA binding protein
MPISKVNSNYQVTIPKEIRTKAKIERGDSVLVEYDEEEGLVKVRPPIKGKRVVWKLGSKLTVADIEAGIEEGQSSY